MKCPVCKEVNLVMADRQGIEIDYCPECRGSGWTAESWISSSNAPPLRRHRGNKKPAAPLLSAMKGRISP